MSSTWQIKDTESGEILANYELLKSQEIFFESEDPYLLYSGGIGSGKTLILVIKAINYCIQYPNNFGLLGRRTYRELQDSVMKTFFEVVRGKQYKHLIANYSKAEARVTFTNGSELVFRHLDDIAVSELRSMNLGFAGIDQAETIPEEVFDTLRGRLRRVGVPHQIFMSCNPALTWLFKKFKQSGDPHFRLIEASTLENHYLPQDYIDRIMELPERLRRPMVEGIWDESLLADKAVFDPNYVGFQVQFEREPKRVLEGLKIYVEPVKENVYQIGVDPSEGIGGDASSVHVVDAKTIEVVAKWKGQIEPAVLAEKVTEIAEFYNGAKIIPEVNGIGLALISKLKELYYNIYRRVEFDKKFKVKVEKLGFRTTQLTKPVMISGILQGMRDQRLKIYDRETIAQLRTFVRSTEANKNGMGAEIGFHDDDVISLGLAMVGLDKAIVPLQSTINQTVIPGRLAQVSRNERPDYFKDLIFSREETAIEFL